MPGSLVRVAFRRWIPLVVIVLCINVSSSLASACGDTIDSLANKLASAVKKADAVFIGKVERFDFINDVPNEFLETRRESIPGLTWETKTAVFSVDRYWKGVDDPEISLVTDETRNSDGTGSASGDDYHFEEGKTYLVFAWKINGYLKTSDCSFTRRDDQIEGILPLLGEGNQPPKPEQNAVNSPQF